MLKRINESLERENAYLKKQLDFFTQACSSKRNSISALTSMASKKKEDSSWGLRGRIMSRIDGKGDNNETESTALFNSKMSSGRKSDPVE